MTPKDEQMHKTEETFLTHSPGKPPTAEPAAEANRPVTNTKRPAMNTTLLNTLASWDRFCALSIRVDQDPGVEVDPALDAALLDLLDEARRGFKAEACRWAEGLYFCALNHAGVKAAEQFARRFQEQLTGRHPQRTVTIGIAPFPQLDFSRGQSLANTCKALDHAAFFGPGSVVDFDATSLNISGDKFYHAGELELAAAEYLAGLELDPGDANLNNSLGVCLARQGDAAAAGEIFQLVLDLDPKETMAVFNLGVLALLREDPEQALVLFRRAYDLDRRILEIPYRIGGLLADREAWQEALEYLEAAIALDDGHWRSFNQKGRCLAKLGDQAAAIQAYTRSVKLNPNDADGLSVLGCLYDACNENPEICEAFFKQSIQLKPNNGLFHHRLGRWHQKNRKTDLALAAFRQASALGHDASREIADLQASEGDGMAATTRCA